jgi:cytochrome c-type biogenesis protein CcmH
LLLVLAWAWIGPALAVQPDEILADPALEARARAISAELRCLVCQNQSIDDSDAELARDLRLLVRERLQAGDSDAAVLDYVVARYGEFVLLDPQWNTRNMLLWVTPLILLLGGGAAVFLAFLRRKPAASPPLTAEERRRLDALLGERGESIGS